MKNCLYFILIVLTISCQNYEKEYIPYNFDYIGNNTINYNGERYNEIYENPFIKASNQQVSTFSIDADGASYSNIRRFLENKIIPPANAVRIEEMINYFIYNYEEPTGDNTIAVNGEVADCPWQNGHKLIRIGIKGKEIKKEDMPLWNMVLLLDVSGSMNSEDKIGLVKEAMMTFVDQMSDDDRLAIVTYAGVAGVRLQSTSGKDKKKIKNVISNLKAEGSTAGYDGLSKAYSIAEDYFIKNGNNRIVLATDGDFNVGPSSQEELIEFIKQKRETGIYLTVIGVGTGNLNDGMMEQLADNGNGNYEYLDNSEQTKKIFIDEIGKFYTIANDVKIQITFDTTKVDSFRLIGYENRILDSANFNNDKKDAGELGAGQNVTALYEIVPKGNYNSGKILTLDLRYKITGESESRLISSEIIDNNNSFDNSSGNMRFAASVAGFGLLLRNSQYKGTITLNNIKSWAENAKAYDPNGYKQGFIDLLNLYDKIINK